MRLDKWLWCARFFKTRGLASEAIKSGKIKINNAKAKPAKLVTTGDQLEIRKEMYTFQIVVSGIPKARLSAALAQELYDELPDSIAARELLAQQIKYEAQTQPRTAGRPTKRDRRQIVRFKTQN